VLTDTTLCGPHSFFSLAPFVLMKGMCGCEIILPYTTSEQIRKVLAIVRVRGIDKVQADYLTISLRAYFETDDRHYIEDVVIRMSLTSVIVENPFAGY
jgi:hypothetical protein